LKVSISARARRDLLRIAERIGAESPSGARRITRRLLERIDDLAEIPLQGRQGRLPNTRELVVTRTPYIVIYRVANDVVTILAVRHTSRRPLG
jgi:toxin ParE1/3/4